MFRSASKSSTLKWQPSGCHDAQFNSYCCLLECDAVWLGKQMPKCMTSRPIKHTRNSVVFLPLCANPVYRYVFLGQAAVRLSLCVVMRRTYIYIYITIGLGHCLCGSNAYSIQHASCAVKLRWCSLCRARKFNPLSTKMYLSDLKT